MAEFLMPSLGSDMETGTLIEWQKNPGDTISRGDIVAVVETQKGAIEIEAFDNGVLESQLVDIGKPVPVGTPLAFIRTQGLGTAPVPEAQAGEKSVKELSTDTQKRSDNASRKNEPPKVPDTVRQRISPAARKLAQELGIDTNLLCGSGPQGAIVLADVRADMPSRETTSLPDAAQESVFPAPGLGLREKSTDTSTSMAEMRKAIAAAMARSKREIPHYYLAQTVDISPAERWLTGINTDRDPAHRVLLGALLVKAVALAAQKYSEFNGFYKDGEFQSATSVHVGMAINLRGGGLVAPAIHDTHELEVDDVMSRMRDLVERVRQGRFRASELTDPTITVSSLGERGVLSLYGVIYPPQVAIVGFGSPAMRPWVTEDNVVQARKLVEITLAADHRVSDGHRGALFLRYIQKKLEKPGKL